MPDQETVTSEQLTTAVDDILKIKPDYASVLELNRKIFIAQEQSRARTRIEKIVIPEDILNIKLKEKFPLINLSEFKIDTDEAARLFSDICDTLKKENNEITEAVAILARAAEDKKIDFGSLFDALLAENESCFETTAGELKVDKDILGFLIYSSVKPSLNVCAAGLSDYLDTNKEWDRGVCPICGSPPALSVFENEGKRFFYCSFCWHKWRTQRIFCHNCGNKEHNTLRYFSFEDEEEHRVDICDKCNNYIKTVDCRNINRFMYPPLEYLATSHLDEKMTEMGFTSNVRS
ncbi:MAG TPA: formate dehydrogenase accessory protein FdhE [Spirochaetota bacterium]|nr:formate dehydrogenase accessory protein FdhE [Spirochaetota bacterium]HPI87884.1 formate dehydrogenase accessory protein FdhE [Spirochaetota bacterium]HPR47384.1 formate dehydrogenase accessory protein FdhE [Spirochaetota bacterium]